MRIAVMGAGGVGGYYGGVLARAGHDVTLIARGLHRRAIEERGLRVESVRSGTFTVYPPVTEDPAEAGPVDLVLFCVKTYHNPEAIPALKPLVGPDTRILTLQNGVDSGEEIASAYGWEHTLPGATYIETTLKEAGVVAQTGGPCRIVFGERDGRETPAARRVLEALQGAGIDAHLSPHIGKDLWTKFLFICAMSGVMCLARSSLGDVLEHPDTRALFLQVLREAEAVGRARGVPLDPDVVERTMETAHQFRQEAVSSMLVDLLRGRPLEVEALNGAVSRMGREVGVPTPVNDVIAAVLRLADAQARRAQG